MITVYNPCETDFSHNGRGVLLPTEALVTETLNGGFELSLTCPITMNSRWWLLENDCIISVPTPDRKNQLFRAYSIIKDMKNTIKVNARHIFYDELFNSVVSMSQEGLTADAAMKLLYASTVMPNSFTASSTISPTITAAVNFTNTTTVNVIFKKDTSKDTPQQGIIQLYGGEILRDNFNITLMPTIGEDRGFVIRHRKNLTGLTFTENCEDVTTRTIPVGQDADGNPLYLPELYIDSPYIGSYFSPKVSTISYSDIKVGQNEMTVEMAFGEMRQRVNELYLQEVDQPQVNVKVNFVLLSQMQNYEKYHYLEDIRLGDVISIYHEELGIALKSKCIKYTYDSVLEQYKTLELGGFKEEITRTIDRSVSTAESAGSALTAHILDRTAHLNDAEHIWLTKAMVQYPVTSVEGGA